MHTLAVITLQQHKFCVYIGKGKLKLPNTCENLIIFALKQFLFYFVIFLFILFFFFFFLENVEKNHSRGSVRLQ